MVATYGYESVIFGVRLTGGTTPTVTLSVYSEDDADNDEWFDLGDTSALSDSDTEAFDTHHQKVYAMVTAVTGDPTDVEVKVMPGRQIGG
jgi:hypothetical protein